MASAFKGPETASAEDVRAQIAQILVSPAFQGSKRCRQFLEYVCEKSLAGETGALKERAIAIEVFGRRPEADWAEDTIVRVGAREVRKRLALYYGTPEGAAARVRIDLPSGGYVPEFRYPETGLSELVPPLAVPAAIPVDPLEPVARRKWDLRLAGLALVGLVAVIAAFFAGRAAQTPVRTSATFERFWKPVIEAREPLLLAVGHPLVYHPSHRALKMSEERLPAPPYPMQRPLHLAPNEVNGSDMVPVINQYVGFGDMVVATEVASMLGHRSKEHVVRMASSIPFADLRTNPAVLIGAMTNRWTMELGQAWRFQFNRVDRAHAIVDKADGSQMWTVPRREDGGAQEDYLLVSRIVHSSTGRLLIVAAGIKQFGTEAAGQLLTDPARLEAVMARIPAGWEDKNLQIVMKVQVIANTPATPELVAWHQW
jgi:hypothetical protein